MSLLRLYQGITRLAAPFMGQYLFWRLKKGKEDPQRLLERQGVAKTQRPSGKLIWLHAASVGESISLLPVIRALRQEGALVLLTTGTVSSATLMTSKLPEGVIHQFAPLDLPQWIDRFLDFWQPSVAVFTESEIWPNIILTCKNRGIPLILSNARLSDRSFKRWRLVPKTARAIFSTFKKVFAQTPEIATNLRELGAVDAEVAGNLKFAAEPLPYDPEVLATFQTERCVWAAVSTHTGEEQIVLKAHKILQKTYPDLLTILIPRHPERTPEIEALIRQEGLSFVNHSQQKGPSADILLVDTLGELGLFYRLSPMSLIGGSLVPVGGHNPIEAVKLGSCVIMGPYTHNCSDITAALGASIVKIEKGEDLAMTVQALLKNPEKRHQLAQEAAQIVADQQNGLNSLVSCILREYHACS